jgi:hypothetical protein
MSRAARCGEGNEPELHRVGSIVLLGAVIRAPPCGQGLLYFLPGRMHPGRKLFGAIDGIAEQVVKRVVNSDSEMNWNIIGRSVRLRQRSQIRSIKPKQRLELPLRKERTIRRSPQALTNDLVAPFRQHLGT